MHTNRLETTVAIGDSIVETDGVTVGDATVEKERLERQAMTVLRLVRYHGKSSVRNVKRASFQFRIIQYL